MVIKRTIIVFTCLLGLAGNLFGQSKVISLWNGNVPGAIPNNNFNQKVDSADNWTKMRFVTHPTLDMYPAPAEKANGTAVIICPGGAYWGIAIDHEGAQVAKWLNSLGVTAFVLNTGCPMTPSWLINL